MSPRVGVTDGCEPVDAVVVSLLSGPLQVHGFVFFFFKQHLYNSTTLAIYFLWCLGKRILSPNSNNWLIAQSPIPDSFFFNFCLCCVVLHIIVYTLNHV